MTLDGLSTLDGVADFFESTVLPGVDPGHRSETRAALKLLRDARAELALLPAVLIEETAELQALLARAADTVGFEPGAEASSTAGTVPELLAAYEDARASITDLVVLLPAQDGPAAAELLGAVYTTLGRHAEQRNAWQSVFPRSPTEGVPS